MKPLLATLARASLKLLTFNAPQTPSDFYQQFINIIAILYRENISSRLVAVLVSSRQNQSIAIFVYKHYFKQRCQFRHSGTVQIFHLSLASSLTVVLCIWPPGSYTFGLIRVTIVAALFVTVSCQIQLTTRSQQVCVCVLVVLTGNT